MKHSIENGCKQLITVCADVKPNETVVIISDHQTYSIGSQLEKAAFGVTTKVIHQVIPVADMHGKEPPADIADLMKTADVIFGVTSMSMAHTNARYQATSRGARYLSLPDYSPELLQRAALFVDFRRLTPIANLLAERFTHGNVVRVSTALGTNLSLKIKGRQGNAAPGWCFEKGALASPPDAEVNVPPVETETNGKLIVDGSIPCRELGLLLSPLTLILENGKITHIEGKQADQLRRVFDKCPTDAAKIAAEFGIGLNPAAELIGSMLEDEGCLGTIHVGFGSNITIGGKNRVPFHLDTIVRHATVHIDDELIMENGHLTVINDLKECLV